MVIVLTVDATLDVPETPSILHIHGIVILRMTFKYLC